MTAQQHTRDLDNFRDALSELRTGGGISEEFAQWYGQVMACLDAITSEFPICASLCDELRSLKYEPLPEMEDAIPEGLPREQVLAQSRRVFFRNQCDKRSSCYELSGGRSMRRNERAVEGMGFRAPCLNSAGSTRRN
jgi:hypothetical protein